MANEYYELIGVSPNATEDEIRQAYARTRREVQKERNEERLKKLLEAKSTLLDPAARKHYDSFQQYGAEVGELQAEAAQATEEEDWGRAIRILKRIVVLVPTEVSAANQLGLAYLYSGDPIEALKIFERLVAAASDVAVYWMNCGHAIMELADIAGDVVGGRVQWVCPGCSNLMYAQHTQLYTDLTCSDCGQHHHLYSDEAATLRAQARTRFQRAYDLEPSNPQPYMQIAISHCRDNHYDQAISWAEKGINADGKVDIGDLEDLFTLSLIYALAEKPDGAYETTRKLLTLSDDDDFPGYLNWRFGKLGFEAAQGFAFERAALWLKCAAICTPLDDEAKGLAEYVRNLADAQVEHKRLRDDPEVVNPLRRRAALQLIIGSGSDDDDFDTEAAGSEIINELGEYPMARLRASVRYVVSQYRATYRLDKGFYDGLSETLDDALRNAGSNYQSGGSTSSSSSSSSTDSCSGCCCMLPALCIIVSAAMGLLVLLH